MPLFELSKRKIHNIQNTITRLQDGDFPLEAGERALERLQRVFLDLEKQLDRAKRLNDEGSISTLAEQINLKINQVLPVLGFILRSTNVRNSFEMVMPFQALSDCLLDGKPKLILSSEWDYVPFAYPQSLEDLKNFVLIGMPASEAGNALLAPLAAHELGHALWNNKSLEGPVTTTLQFCCEDLYQKNDNEFRDKFPEYKENDMVAKEVLPENIAMSVEYAAKQAEELFCDMFAYAIFGLSYLYAFAYILAPGSGKRPNCKYPAYATRVLTLRVIAEREGVTLPSISQLGLTKEAPSGSARQRFVVRMAEESVAKNTDALWNEVKNLVDKAAIARPLETYERKHTREFQRTVPGHDPRSLGDIVNAGWAYYRSTVTTAADKEMAEKAYTNLNELVLKTMEVLEFRSRTIPDDTERKGNMR